MVNIVRSLLGLDEDDGKEIVKATKEIKKKEKKAKAKKPEPKPKGYYKIPKVETADPKPEEPSRYEEKELASKRVGDDE